MSARTLSILIIALVACASPRERDQTGRAVLGTHLEPEAGLASVRGCDAVRAHLALCLAVFGNLET